jgi:hypothetical protein
VVGGILLGVTDTGERFRQILDALPEVQIEVGGERDQHLGASIREKRFAWYLDDHHGDGRVAITCKAPPGVNEAMVDSNPAHFFLPS